MTVSFSTEDNAGLLKMFDAAIRQEAVKGKIETWRKHSTVQMYTHVADNWKSLAWFKPAIEPGNLVFSIRALEGKTIADITYAYYCGHLIETFLKHFPESFTSAAAVPRRTKAESTLTLLRKFK